MEPQEAAVAGSSASQRWNLLSKEMETVAYRNVKDKVNVLLSYFVKTLAVLKRISWVLLQLKKKKKERYGKWWKKLIVSSNC